MSRFPSLYSGLLVALAPLSAFAIAGGNPLSDELAPHVVNIHMKNGMCTGTMISPNVVLTAAHCVDISGPADVVAYISPKQRTKPCDIANVLELAHEPSALPILPLNVHSPDLLLIRLDRPLCSVKVAKLEKTMVQPGDIYSIAGHGEGNKIFSQTETMKTRIIETEQARSQVNPINDWSDQILSIGSKTYRFGLPVMEKTSVCSGDSGGPVYQDREGEMLVFGVNGATLPNVNFGAKCNHGYLQVITPIAPYFEWIQQKLLEWKIPREN